MVGRLDNRHDIELAEGISVHLRPASMVPRVMAKLLDVLIISVLHLLVYLLFIIGAAIMGSELMIAGITISGFLIYWFYDVFFELGKHAGSPGKRMLKLKVVKLSGAPSDFSSSFMRALILPIDYLPVGLIGMVSSLSNKHSQRLGDLAAGTLVVHKLAEEYTELQDLPVKPVRPSIPLKREEQLAFLEFGRRYTTLSAERQNEIVACLAPHMKGSPSAMEYALGVAHWLKQNEV